MIYKDYKGKKLSGLGFGCMRFPVIEGDNANIDKEKTAQMIDIAMKNGINYYDTAWAYHSGQSERVMGEILAKYPRDSFYLATKFPGYDSSCFEDPSAIFEKQLEKTGAGYFDFYLFHNVTEGNIDNYLNEEIGLLNYLLEQKKAGKIRHLGFSTHGKYETVKRFLDAYGEHIEFCQIQLNWIDWEYQKAKDLVELLNQRNIPIWVMEPLRGGKLASISEENINQLKELRPDEGIPAWAFRFLETIPGVTMILSGMSNVEQLEDNLKTFSESKPLNEKEKQILLDIANKMTNEIPCTQCRYCTDGCVKNISIPEMIKIYNTYSFNKRAKSASDAIDAYPTGSHPDDCIGCGACEQVCPQNIKIPQIMKKLSEIKESAKQ